jgi:apolipoprotein N-acyltransferase
MMADKAIPLRQAASLAKALRAASVCLLLGMVLTSAGCESETDRKAKEAAALQAKFDQQLKAENAATARALEERARADREASKERAVATAVESEAAFAQYIRERPSMTVAEESTAAELGVARLRARMSDPDTMELRNQHLNASKNAVCAEVNYKDGSGKYLGFRRAFVTTDVIWVEPAADDPTHRVFEMNLKRVGCAVAAP